MPFGRELSHLVAEQINKAVSKNDSGGSSDGISRSTPDEGRFALLEANLQRLSEQFTSFLGTQKKTKRNMVDYGLEVLALHDMRVTITSGRAIFADQEEPFDAPYMYLQLSRGGATRQIRYIYLNREGVVLESTTDPTNIGEDHLPLALIDIWSNSTEITQDKIQDIRPRAGASAAEQKDDSTGLLSGNVSLYSPDTGTDSFIVSETTPAGLKVSVTSGRALVDGEILNAEGGILDLTKHREIIKEFLGVSDGERAEYTLYHQSVSEVVVYVDDEEAVVAMSEELGTIQFDAAPASGAVVSVSYKLSGNYMMTFLVEKVRTKDGQSFGVLGWKIGSNRTPMEPPKLTKEQHIIAKVDLSTSIDAISSEIIDNRYEVVNLTQEDLQFGEKLDSSSLKDGAVIADKIAANSIVSTHIVAGSIDAAKIKSGAIEAQHIAVGAIKATHIGADTITADMIKGGTINADKFESSTWGDLSQAIRFVKAILGGAKSWRKCLDKLDLSIGERHQVSYDSEAFPTLRLEATRRWDVAEPLGELTLPFVLGGGEGTKTLWDEAYWDKPVYESGYWESASIDYGLVTNLQAEFWGQPLIQDAEVGIKVQARYSTDHVTWTDYETLSPQGTAGYLYWVGTLQSFRYFKVRVEFTTTDPMKYVLLAYPELRVASCQIGNVGDIRFPAMTVKEGELKLNGAMLLRESYPALWHWANSNKLVASEAEWLAGKSGLFGSGDGIKTFRLPDHRGQFYRALDEGHGLDDWNGRSIGTAQGDAIRDIQGSFSSNGNRKDIGGYAASGAFEGYNAGSGHSAGYIGSGYGMLFKASKVVPTAQENRPKNLAYFACIRYE